MRAMVFHERGRPLVLEEVPRPHPAPDEVLIEIACCGVCRTDLHIIDGDLPSPKRPLIPGHQIVGTIVERGRKVEGLALDTRVGVAWLASTCGTCSYCREAHENLCDHALFTGYGRDGGFAEYCTAKADYVFPLSMEAPDRAVAPLLCGGMVGYRAFKLTGRAKRVGFYGFGASAHLLAQLVRAEGGEVYAFIRPGNERGKAFAAKQGAVWTGWSEERPPIALDAAILFAPVGEHYLFALKAVKKGGVVVSAGIHMSDIPSFPYHLLWEERVMRSVANLTREDGKEFLALAERVPIVPETTLYPLEKTNAALEDLKKGRLQGTAVIVMR